ncbi:MAG: Gfo/Idh/MocA family oxidoreductase [Fimbriimonadaceae bacterium]
MAKRDLSRRDFLTGSAALGATAMMPNFAFGQTRETMKVGLIGCGGRGRDAAINVIDSAEGVEIVALADAFADRTQQGADVIKQYREKNFKVPKDQMFTGLDAYEKVMQCDLDMVILTTPPAFRADHLTAAIKAGKHVFMEKPVAVDGEGVLKVFDAADLAKSKGLAIVAGTQRRHEDSYREVMKRIHDGAIGDVVSMRCYWNQGGLWSVNRTPEMTDLEWQMRNWLYFTWLSGDHICEQHIHNIDVCLWASGKTPKSAVGLGGREVRTAPVFGQIYDHFAVEFDMGDDVKIHSYCRQQDGTKGNVSEFITGTKGKSNGNGRIMGENAYRWDGEKENPYMVEHRDLIASIRAGTPLNEGRQVAESTLAAIMGRFACYTGQEVTREQALATKGMVPSELSFDMKLPVAPVCVPGTTKMEDFS